MPGPSAIPVTKHAAVRAALQATFGAAHASDVRFISGGVSGALILLIHVGDRPYVLRIEPERIALRDRERHFACMALAAAAGTAPPLRYADPVEGVAILDFVAARPLSDHPGGAAGLARGLGELLACVQATPPFPSVGDCHEGVARLLDRLGEAGVLAPADWQLLREGLKRVRAILPWDPASLVSSHNDPNPRNILFDGRRLWLIDWELACLNDPLVDLAILTTDVVEDPAARDVLLQAALGVAPDRALHARLNIVRLLTRLSYGCIVLDSLGLMATAPADAVDLSPAAFRRAVLEGRLASGAPETALAFARMSLAAFRRGVAAPGFAEAERIVRNG